MCVWIRTNIDLRSNGLQIIKVHNEKDILAF